MIVDNRRGREALRPMAEKQDGQDYAEAGVQGGGQAMMDVDPPSANDMHAMPLRRFSAAELVFKSPSTGAQVCANGTFPFKTQSALSLPTQPTALGRLVRAELTGSDDDALDIRDAESVRGCVACVRHVNENEGRSEPDECGTVYERGHPVVGWTGFWPTTAGVHAVGQRAVAAGASALVLVAHVSGMAHYPPGPHWKEYSISIPCVVITVAAAAQLEGAEDWEVTISPATPQKNDDMPVSAQTAAARRLVGGVPLW